MRNFLMIDTETFGDVRFDGRECGSRNLYEFGFCLMQKGEIVSNRAFLCADALNYCQDFKDNRGRFPTYFPDRIMLDFDAHYNASISKNDMGDVICRAIQYARKNKLPIVAKNPCFDCGVINQYLGFDLLVTDECIDLQARLVKALPKKYAYSVPNTASGLATFKADHVVPFLLGAGFTQAHDAAGDAKNQALIMLLLDKRKKGTSRFTSVVDMMREYHSLNNVPLFSGTYTLKKG